MPVTYGLGPNPKWYFADESGKPLGDGYVAFYRSINPTQVKLVYQDNSGLFPWPLITIPNRGTQKGIQIDENGTQGPFYFSTDSTLNNDTYYFEVYDSEGVLQWTIDNYFPNSSGGGGVITVARNLKNIMINNVFWRNIGSTPSPIPDLYTAIAPGANTGLALTPSLFGGEIVFIKNNMTATDQIQFIPFSLGDTPFINDVTPDFFCRYTSTAGSSESKYFQIPVTKGVQNLNNQIVTFTIWARSNAGTTTLTCQLKQFFGDGTAPSIPINIPIDNFNLIGGIWEKFTQQVVIPSIAGKIIGECGNDGLFLQIQPPLNSNCNIDFTKFSLYLGDIAPDEDYQTYDMINSVIDSPRTADKKEAFNNEDFGWIPLNDGTIGSSLSNATTRRNTDTFPLYNFIWNKIDRNWCPVVGGAGTTAIEDFINNKPIFLPRQLGRVSAGTINYQLSVNFTADFTTNILSISDTSSLSTGSPVSFMSGPGGTLPSALIMNQVYYVNIINGTQFRIYVTAENAINNFLPISLINNGTPPNIMMFGGATYPLGGFKGNEIKSLTAAENGPHTHGVTHLMQGSAQNAPGNYPDLQPSKTTVIADDALQITILSSGEGKPFQIIQPTTYINMFIKL